MNPVVHFEISGSDGGGLVDYYRALFGWPMRDMPLPGWPVHGHFLADEGVSGAVGTAEALAGGRGVVLYVEVDDVESYIDRGERLGGKTVLPVTELPDAGVTVGWLRDPQGNIVGLVRPS